MPAIVAPGGRRRAAMVWSPGSAGASRSGQRITEPKSSAAAAPSTITGAHRRAMRRGRVAGSAMTDPRDEDTVEKIDREVQEDERGRDHEHDRLEQREVARQDRLHGEPPDAGPRED